MKILVTGGAGFIGANFVRYWQENHPKDDIVIADNLTYAGDLRRIKDLKHSFLLGDIADSEFCRKAVAGVDLIVHFAAESHVDRSNQEPGIFIKTNIIGTYNLLEAARTFKVRFHHVSTDEVFGSLDINEKWQFNEQSPYSPNNIYSATKASADHLVRAYHKVYGLPVTISNCSNNYGPFQHPEKFIPRAITRILTGNDIRVYAPGNQIRDWIYVDDHSRAIDLIINKGKIGETYCIGGETKANLEIAQKILDLLDIKINKIQMIKNRVSHDEKYDIDWSKIKKLGWKPTESFDTGLQKTLDWYIQNTNWWEVIIKPSEAFYKNSGEKVL